MYSFNFSFQAALAQHWLSAPLCLDSWHYSEGVTREQLYRNAKPLYRLSERQLEILGKARDLDAIDFGAISISVTSRLYDFIP